MARRRGDRGDPQVPGRALLVATGSCAVNCRYCFRRHFPYAEDTAARAGWREAVETIRADRSHRGSDPVRRRPAVAGHPKLAELTDALAASRTSAACASTPACRSCCPSGWMPACWPGCAACRGRSQSWSTPTMPTNSMPRRCGDGRACAMPGATLLNQAVLLRGVNDSRGCAGRLCERGFAAGVLPYYLHQLDRVEGAAHFEVDDAQALALHAALAARLPGYLVPKLVREVAGAPGKTPLQAVDAGLPVVG
jgi:hypothetical protein